MTESDVPVTLALLEDAIDTIGDLFYLLDEDGQLLYWNVTLESVTGYDADELEGLTTCELFPDDDQDTIQRAVSEALETGQASITVDLLTYGGERIPYEFNSRRLDTHDGPVLVGIGRDITERRERKRQLEQSASRFDAIFEDPTALIGLLDADGRIERVNRTALETIGADSGQFRGERFSETPWWNHSETLQEQLEEWIDRAVDGEVVRFEAEHPTTDGEMIVDGVIQPVYEGDTVVSLVVQARDITQRRAMERTVRRNERALRELYEVAATDGRFEDKLDDLLEIGCRRLDLEFGAFLRTAEYSSEVVAVWGDANGFDCPNAWLLSSAYRQPDDEDDDLVAATDVSADDRIDPDTAERLGLGCYIAATVFLDGTAHGTLVFGADEPRDEAFTAGDRAFVELLAQWSGAEIERQRSKRRLERQNERLDQFASVVSHDLRNPLSVATGYLEIAREDVDDETIQEPLEEAADALERMSELIEELLSLSRSGAEVEDSETIALADAVDDAWSQVPAEGSLSRTEGLGTVRADAARLRRLLENLFRNALEHGGDRIEVGPLDQGFYVEDDGPGIPPDERERVFEYGHTNADDGTGLGLAIVRDIVEAHGWSIRITDGDEGGARFEVTDIDTA